MEMELERGERSRLARESGYSQQMLSYILLGKRRPHWRSDKLKNLVENTGVPKTIWLDGDPNQIVWAIIKGGKYDYAKSDSGESETGQVSFSAKNQTG